MFFTSASLSVTVSCWAALAPPGSPQALRGNETRRYEAAHSSTCPDVRGADNESSACIRSSLRHKMGRRIGTNAVLYPPPPPPLNQEDTKPKTITRMQSTRQKATRHRRSNGDREEHVLIPVRAAVTHGVRVAPGSSPTGGEVAYRGHPQGSFPRSADRDLQDGLTASL